MVQFKDTANPLHREIIIKAWRVGVDDSTSLKRVPKRYVPAAVMGRCTCCGIVWFQFMRLSRARFKAESKVEAK